MPDLSPDAPIVSNAQGGRSSDPSCRLDLVDAAALLRIGEIFDYGAKKYSENNWRRVTINTQLNHALVHIYAYLAGNHQDDHLAHAATRAIMALAVYLEQHKS